MCVVLAKYFDDYGWVAVKNRDRNYTPEITFQRKHTPTGTEILLFNDKITGYSEGINSSGVGILSASLMVINDEKEVSKSNQERSSPDGARIRKALREATAAEAAEALVDYQLTGNTVIIDQDSCFLLEACANRAGKYRHKMRQIPIGDTVARTNHGIWLPWCGYQRIDSNKNQTLSRISSEARLAQAEFVVETAEDPDDLIDGMCQVIIDHPQLNIMRTDTHRKKMRTTAQFMLIPSQQTMYCRPVSSHISFDFWKLNRPGPDTWVEILSNRALYRDDKDNPPFSNNNTKHTLESDELNI